ncbi:MAG: helix-turn-helix domain-containing protein [Bacteroidales bacterium]
MKSRIEQIMLRENMNASRFADHIGLNRAALSHILSGRNNPSLDVVTKILTAFPNINSEWLLFGKGEELEEGNRLIDTAKDATYSKQLFPVEESVKIEAPAPPKSVITSKKISRILIFYNDNTFETIIPDPSAEGLL